MSTQTKLIRFRALRLARQLEACGWDGTAPQLIADAAVELRLLHVETQRCRNACDATAEGWRTDAEEWKAERDALAERTPSGDAEVLLRDAREALWQPSNPDICKRIDDFLGAARKESK